MHANSASSATLSTPNQYHRKTICYLETSE